MQVLGAILAGGRSRRFGRDKASEPLEGVAMLERVAAALAPQVNAIVVCGRSWPGFVSLADLPQPGIGPLGGLLAALTYAHRHGYSGVLSLPVDVLPVPNDLALRLIGPRPAVLQRQYLLGWWPACEAGELTDWVTTGGRALHAWLDHRSVRRVVEPDGMININHPEDLPVRVLAKLG